MGFDWRGYIERAKHCVREEDGSERFRFGLFNKWLMVDT